MMKARRNHLGNAPLASLPHDHLDSVRLLLDAGAGFVVG
jgi:hypothetical protein